MATCEKGFKVRLLPTEEQSQMLFQFAGAARFIWNQYLRWQEENYDTSKPYISRNDVLSGSELFKKLKEFRKLPENIWLNKVPQHMLAIIREKDMKYAYDAFFRNQWKNKEVIRGSKEWRKYHPKPKCRKDNKWTFPLDNGEVYFTYTKDGKLCARLAKIGKVLVKTNLNVPAGTYTEMHGSLKNIRIKFINNKWIISFMIKCENQACNHSDKVIGIDVGLKVLCAATNCNNDVKIFKNINKTATIRKLDRKLRRYDQQLSNKYNVNNKKDSAHKWQRTKGVEKLLKRRRKLYYHLSNIRKNYLHHVTHEIIMQNPKAIVLEDFTLDFMIQNHKLAKTTQESLLGEFRRQLTYKSEWNGIELILAPQNYPSTQLCSNCGHKQPMPLDKRTYECPSCGMVMDRDINAAKNLEKYYSIVH